MSFKFPDSPTVGLQTSSGNRTWEWNGSAWKLVTNYAVVQGIQGVQGFSGFQGTQGSNGIQGRLGSQGLQGKMGPVAGSSSQVIYNNGGVAAGATNFVYDGINQRVGVGSAIPQYKLDVAGDINFNGSLYQGGSLFISSKWTSGAGTTIYRNSFVGINTSTPQYNLDVNGDINFNGSLYQGGSPFISSKWTSGSGTDIYRNSYVGIGTTDPLQDLHVFGNVLVAAGSSTEKHITLKPYEINNGTLSWEGSAGQLFSITNSLASGSIFSVNDVSGIPSIDVNADGTVSVVPYGGSIGIGTTVATRQVDITGNVRLRSGLYDSRNNVGAAGSVLISTGAGVSWTTPVQGVQGVQATQGILGTQGTAGTSVRIVGSLALTVGSEQTQLNSVSNSWYPAQAGDGVIDSNTGNLWVYTGTVWNNVGSVRGPQGLQGLQGTQGLSNQGTQGLQGLQGRQGTQGLQGMSFQGTQATQGLQGLQGLQGTQGTQGLQGSQGTQGLQGSQGTQGTQGTQGLQGSQGSQATQGLQGLQGSQGLQGFTGGQGTQGTQGLQGLQGSQGLQGFTGGQGTQGTQGLSNQGVQGLQGLQGTQGNQGIGVQGTQGLVGTSAAANVITASNATTITTLYPVMVTAAGIAATAYITTTANYFTFDSSNGQLTVIDLNSASDEKMKTNINPISNSIELLNQMRPVSFNWKDSKRKSYGLIAQELEEVLPELINESADGDMKSIKYIPIISLLIDAVCQLSNEIEKRNES